MISSACEIICSNGQTYPWFRVECPTEEEISYLEKCYKLPHTLIQEVLDPDELARSEFISEIPARLVIIRIPNTMSPFKEPAKTVPLCFWLVNDALLSISNKKSLFFDRDFFCTDQIKVESVSCFVLQSLLYSASDYLHRLKALDGVINELARQLDGSVYNSQVIRLFKIEKSLHYFQTSLRSNEILLEKLPKSHPQRVQVRNNTLFMEGYVGGVAAQQGVPYHPGWTWGLVEKELLEDVSIEMREAVEITQIYLKILHSMTTAFSSVADNNLNVAMKRLTLISVVLMLPTVFASFFGMNVLLPFTSMDNHFSFWIVSGLSIGVSAIMLVVLKLGKFF